jgi:hypothetical protein
VAQRLSDGSVCDTNFVATEVVCAVRVAIAAVTVGATITRRKISACASRLARHCVDHESDSRRVSRALRASPIPILVVSR